MAISYVGGKGAGTAGQGGGSITLTTGLTGGSGGAPIAGDLVVVTVSVGTQARAPTLSISTPSGYTELTAQRTTATTYDTNVQTSYKVMGGTPDTAVTIPASGNVADGIAYTIQVFRGVDGTTPMDATATYATGSGTDNRPNPAAITPVTAGAWIVCCGGGAAAAGTTLYTAAYLTNLLTYNGADTNDGTVGSGYYTGWTSGAYDPAVFGGGSVNAANSWGATTLALRPMAEAQTLTPGLLSNSQTFHAATVTPGTATLSPSLVAGSEVFYAASVTPGAVTLTASRASNDQTFYTPTVTQGGGGQTLTPGLFSNGQTFYAANVTPGEAALTATRYDNGQAFYAPQVSAGFVILTPARVDNAQAFYAPIVAAEGGAQTLTQGDRLDNSQEFYSSVVADVATAGGGSGFRMVDTPSRLWWKRKPKVLPEEVADQKIRRVAGVIERIARDQAASPEPVTVQREQARQIVAPLVAEMPGFDWSAMYRYAIDRLIQQRLAEQLAAQEIERIRLLEADEDDVFLLLMVI